jgi:Fe-S oxidoreductase
LEQGWLDAARRQLRRTLDAIGDGVTLAGVEPSCVSMLRDDLRALLPEDPRAAALAARTMTFAELLLARRVALPRASGRVLYHHHCHEAAVLSRDAGPALLRALGYDVVVLDAGCCGMAGAFGFQQDKYAVSTALAERVLLPALRAAPPGTLVVADGWSCREQVRQLCGVSPLHTAQVVRDALR